MASEEDLREQAEEMKKRVENLEMRAEKPEEEGKQWNKRTRS